MGSPTKNSGGTMVLKSFLNLSLVANLQHTDKTKFLAIEKVDCLISSGMSLRSRAGEFPRLL